MRKPLYQIPEKKRVRVIVDSDAACECDDQIAIVHALMSEKVKVCALTAEHFGENVSETMEKSYQEMKKVVELMGIDAVPILRGESKTINSESDSPLSEGAQFMITEAMKEDTAPLFVICQGAVTNVAAALMCKPEIGKKMTVIWVGGTNYPYGGYEFNTFNDIGAANVLLNSAADVWMLPMEVYSTLQVGLEEMYWKVNPYGEIGRYLYENMIDGNIRINEMMEQRITMSAPQDYLGFPNGGSWAWGDSCAIGVLLSTNSGDFELQTAPFINPDGSYHISENGKKIRVYKNVNTRFIIEDFFAKIRWYFPKE